MKRLLVIAAMVALAGPNGALAEPSSDTAPFYYFPDIPSGLLLNGIIDFRSPLAFRRAIEMHPQIRTVVLQSDGGSVQAALLIAEEIFDRKLNTVIAEDSVCASACSFMFFAGHERVAFGKLGVHQIYGTGDAKETQMNLSDIIEVLGKYDVSSAVITKMLRTPPNDMYFFTAEEIENFRINRTLEAGNSGDASAEEATSQNIPIPLSKENKGDGVRDRALRFILNIINASTLPKADLLTVTAMAYADSVNFYGTQKQRADVLSDKSNYLDRWPIRETTVEPNSVASICWSGICSVSGRYQWSVSSPARNKRASGLAEFRYEVDMNTLKIVGETGKVLQRN